MAKPAECLDKIDMSFPRVPNVSTAEVQIKKWNFFDVKQRYSARTQQQRVQQRQHQPQLRFEQAGKQEAFVRMA